MLLKAIIMFIWQLPQNIVALLLLLFSRSKSKQFVTLQNNSGKLYYYRVSILPKYSAISLGNFILVANVYSIVPEIILHEYGHQLQSRKLGPLFLIAVGIPSFIRAIVKKILKKDSIWYMSGYPEHWANKLAGLVK